MRRKLLVIGITVIIIGIVPAAALNHLRDRQGNVGEYPTKGELNLEKDQGIVGDNPLKEEGDPFEDPMDPRIKDGLFEDFEEEEASKDSEESLEDGSRNENAGEKEAWNPEEDKEEKSSQSSTEKKDRDDIDQDDQTPWRELNFTKTLDTFLEDVKGDLNRRNLAKLSVLFYEQLSGDPAVAAWEGTFEDTKNSWVLKAYNLEITPPKAGEKFNPDQEITRQEAAYTFYRTLRALKRPYPEGDIHLVGEDVESIENWAYDAMVFMDYYEILPRRDRNRLDPQKQITEGEIKALWNNTGQWINSYDQHRESLRPPKGVFATEEKGEAKIGWDPVKEADYYHVYESLSKDGPFQVFNDENGRPLKIHWEEDYSLKVTGLTEGQTYYYRVRSVVDGIRSFQSEVVKITATKSQGLDFEDYEEYLMKDHGKFTVGDRVITFENIEITRGNKEDSLQLRYFLDSENSKKLREVIKDGYREDVRTLYGYIIRELSEFYEKDIDAYLIYQDHGLEEYPKQYQDNRIERDPIGKDGDGTYFVWFPYLEMGWDFIKGSYTHRWFYETEGV